MSVWPDTWICLSSMRGQHRAHLRQHLLAALGDRRLAGVEEDLVDQADAQAAAVLRQRDVPLGDLVLHLLFELVVGPLELLQLARLRGDLLGELLLRAGELRLLGLQLLDLVGELLLRGGGARDVGRGLLGRRACLALGLLQLLVEAVAAERGPRPSSSPPAQGGLRRGPQGPRHLCVVPHRCSLPPARPANPGFEGWWRGNRRCQCFGDGCRQPSPGTISRRAIWCSPDQNRSRCAPSCRDRNARSSRRPAPARRRRARR